MEEKHNIVAPVFNLKRMLIIKQASLISRA